MFGFRTVREIGWVRVEGTRAVGRRLESLKLMTAASTSCCINFREPSPSLMTYRNGGSVAIDLSLYLSR